MDQETLMVLSYVAVVLTAGVGCVLWEMAYDRRQFNRLSIGTQQRQLSLVVTLYARRAKNARRS